MSFTGETSRFTHPGDGTATPFVVSAFVVFQADQLVLTSRVTATDVVSPLTEGVHYTVAIASPLPGLATITPLASIPVGTEWRVLRDTTKEQTVGFTDATTFPASALTEGLDRVAMAAAELEERAERAIHQARTEPLLVMEIPRLADRASMLAGYDSSGLPTAVDPVTLLPGSITVGAFGQTILPLATAALWRSTMGVPQALSNLKAIDVDTDANEPPGSTGDFLFIARDTGRVSTNVDTGAVVNDVGHLVEVVDAFPASSAALADKLYLSRDHGEIKRDTGSGLQAVRTYSPWHIHGLWVSWNTATTFRVWRGGCRDTVDNVGAELTGSTWTKTFNTAGTWVAGTGNNAVPSTVISAGLADKVFPVFMIFKPDGTFDFVVDLPGNRLTCAEGLNVAGPAYAAGFRTFRRIGWITSNATPVLINFFQIQNNYYYVTPILAGSAIAVDAKTSSYYLTLDWTPPGCTLHGNVMIGNDTGNSLVRVSGRGSPVGLPADSVAPGAHERIDGLGTTKLPFWGLQADGSYKPQVQIRTRDDTSIDVYCVIDGWGDDRTGDLQYGSP